MAILHKPYFVAVFLNLCFIFWTVIHAEGVEQRKTIVFIDGNEKELVNVGENLEVVEIPLADGKDKIRFQFDGDIVSCEVKFEPKQKIYGALWCESENCKKPIDVYIVDGKSPEVDENHFKDPFRIDCRLPEKLMKTLTFKISKPPTKLSLDDWKNLMNRDSMETSAFALIQESTNPNNLFQLWGRWLQGKEGEFYNPLKAFLLYQKWDIKIKLPFSFQSLMNGIVLNYQPISSPLDKSKTTRIVSKENENDHFSPISNFFFLPDNVFFTECTGLLTSQIPSPSSYLVFHCIGMECLSHYDLYFVQDFVHFRSPQPLEAFLKKSFTLELHCKRKFEPESIENVYVYHHQQKIQFALSNELSSEKWVLNKEQWQNIKVRENLDKKIHLPFGLIDLSMVGDNPLFNVKKTTLLNGNGRASNTLDSKLRNFCINKIK